MKTFLTCIILLLFVSTNLFSQDDFIEHKIIGDIDISPNYVLCVDIDDDNDMDYVICANGLSLYTNDGSMNFERNEIHEPDTKFLKVDSADINNDGALDLIALTENSIVYFRNEGNSEFSKQIIYTQDNLKKIEAIDFDLDGDIDILSSSGGFAYIHLHKNEGNNTFVSNELEVDVRGIEFTAVDIDLDNDIDLITSFGHQGSQIYLYKNDGSQNFVRNLIVNNSSSIFLTTSDLDNDGDLDIISSEPSNKIIWYKNNGQDNFQTNEIVSHGSNNIQITDINDDGWQDILLSDDINNTINILENNATQSFVEVTISDSLISPKLGSVADIDGDNNLDIMVSSSHSNMVAMLINVGNNSFTYQEAFTNPRNLSSVKSADLDQDGDLDIILSASDKDRLVCYENDGNNNFTYNLISDQIPNLNIIQIADLNQDCDLDIILSASGKDRLVCYENDGNNNFTYNLISDQIPKLNKIRIADLNSDNFLDIITFSSKDGKIRYYKNDGNQNYTVEVLFADFNSQINFELADLDSDSDLDIIMNSFDQFTDGKLLWYENDGNQNFTFHIIDPNKWISKFEIMDINNDGNNDLLAYSPFHRKEVGWFENNGNQNFTYKKITESYNRDVYSVTSGDYNNDGYVDFVTSFAGDLGNGNLSYNINDGDGTFTYSAIPWVEHWNEAYLRTSDLNNDRIPDIIDKGYMIPDNVHWLDMAHPDNGWKTIRGALKAPFYVSSNDMDGDGDNDMILGEATKNKISWYENKIKPTTVFEADTLLGDPPFTVTFSNNSYGNITNWLWNFGDDSTSTDKNPSHTYNIADTFTVSLTATGPNGSTTITKENYIKVSGLTSVTEEETIPQKYLLYNNYPNPFNPSTKIKFDVKEKTHVVLKVYDIQGREVETIVNEELTPASYEKSFNASQLSSGVYFYRVSMGNYNAVKKMVLLK